MPTEGYRFIAEVQRPLPKPKRRQEGFEAPLQDGARSREFRVPPPGEDANQSRSNANGTLRFAVASGAVTDPPLLAATSSITPRDVPALRDAWGDFIGREAEIEELKRAARKGGLIIYGMGGVGKTELALRVAYELKPEFPDGQLSFDLEGVSPHARTTAEAMAHVIRAFGATDESSAFPRSRSERSRHSRTEAELEPRYQSVLHEKKAILLFDNAKDEAQVARLTPPETCTMLVTSRQHLTVNDLKERHLDVLPPSDAQRLLLKVCDRINGEVEEIAKLCGYLPLALRAAACAVKKSPNVTAVDYVRQLKGYRARLDLTEPSRNASIEAVMDLSYKLLRSEDQHRFRSLSILRGEFDVEGAAAVWGCHGRAPQRALTTLMQYSLVEYNAAADRYRLHDLIRDFAWEHLREKPSERKTAGRRHAIHYKEVAVRSEALYIRGGKRAKPGLDLFDLEWENIKAGQAWAADHANRDDEARQLCSDYPRAAEGCLELRRPPQERISWGEVALGASQKLKDRRAECLHHEILGLAYAELGDPRTAREHHLKERKLARKNDDRGMEGYALNGLGFDSADLGRTKEAIGYYKQALAIFRKVGDRMGKTFALGNLAEEYIKQKKPALALDCQKKSYRISHAIGFRRSEAQDLGGIGVAYTALGKPLEAIKYHKKALAIDREIGDRKTESEDLAGLGDAFAASGRFGTAIEKYEEAIRTVREWGDGDREGKYLWKLAKALHGTGDSLKAIEQAEAALGILKKVNPHEAAKIRGQLAIWRRRK